MIGIDAALSLVGLAIDDSPCGVAILAANVRFAGVAVVEAPIRRATVGWKAVPLERCLAPGAGLGTRPGKSPLYHPSKHCLISCRRHSMHMHVVLILCGH